MHRVVTLSRKSARRPRACQQWSSNALCVP